MFVKIGRGAERGGRLTDLLAVFTDDATARRVVRFWEIALGMLISIYSFGIVVSFVQFCGIVVSEVSYSYNKTL